MFKNFLAYLLMAIGFLGLLFFLNYKGNIISYPNLYIIPSVCLIFFGIFLPIFFRRKTLDNKLLNSESIESNGEEIFLDISNCDIKQNSYFEETKERNIMYNVSRIDPPNYAQQSCLTYYNKKNDGIEKFESQVFPFDSTMLKVYIEDKKIVLIVDKIDRSKYLFKTFFNF